MIIRSRAPLRLGLAGGGTDVSPWSDLHGGAILNTTISLFAYASLEPLEGDKIELVAADRNETFSYDCARTLPPDGNLDLLKGVYNAILSDFRKEPFAFRLTTYVDAPPGSGLGSSSTLVVAAIGAFVEWFGLPLGEYDIAHLAYDIERVRLRMAGGKQDQYAATFGGVNYMEFYAHDKVIVNPLRIRNEVVNELENNLLLYQTSTSRVSSEIIERQSKNLEDNKTKPMEAMHRLKEQAVMMKEAILKGECDAIGEILDFGWRYKKELAEGITNPAIEEIYNLAKKAGASGGKVSGAGGGGFIMFYCPGNTRYAVMKSLESVGGEFRGYKFTKNGLTTWRM